jgi:protein-glutamine gamma-glutamyltransferase
MRFGAALHLATLAAAGAAFGTAAVGGNLNPLFVLGWYVGWLVSAAVPEGRFGGAWVLGAGLLAGPALGAAIVSGGLDVVLAAIYFASILLLARVFTRQGVEGHGQVLLLSILVLAGGAAVSPDLTFLPVFIVYLFAVTFGLLLNHLRREGGEAVLPLPLREVAGRGLIVGTAWLGAFAVAFTAGTFLVFPRTTFGLGMTRAPGGGDVGLSDRIELAGFGRIKENDRVVLRIRPDPGVSGLGDDLGLYWRAQVLEDYDDRSWRSADRDVDSSFAGHLTLWPSEAGATLDRLDVEVVSHLGVPVLPIPDQTQRVHVHHRSALGQRIALRQAGAREIRTVGSPTPPYAFRVDLDRRRRVVDDGPPGPEHLALPDQHLAIVALAGRLFDEAGRDPDRYAEVLEQWLMQRFVYSLDLPADPSLYHFLLERRAGHCEYFATAMTVLLRLRGVPSRVVIGFHGGRLNESGGYYVVRQGDAHAWVEVFREGVGWVRFDPTPEDGRGRGLDPPTFLQRLSDRWDAWQVRWVSGVLTFDRSAQQSLGRRISQAFDDVARAFGGDGGRDRGDLGRILLFIVGGLVVSALVFLGLKRRAAGRPGGDTMTPDARRAQAVYRTFLSAVQSAGIERAPHHTPDEILGRIEARGDAAAARRAEAVIRRYQASRFGARPLSADEARNLMDTARRIGESLGGRRAG